MRPERKIDYQRVPSSEQEDFRVAVFEGLSRVRKSLPCRFFYDARGSELFEQITNLPEYYPTRIEAGILTRYAPDIACAVPIDSVLIEFGAGSSMKTEILLDQVAQHVTYVPIDVSPTALNAAAHRLDERYPSLEFRPIVADFSQPITLPPDLQNRPRTGFFPGSTIGNLTRPEVIALLDAFRTALGAGSNLIIGVDLKKDARRLVLAYNDSEGVTAAFNLNLLSRINRELEGSIDVEAFRHEAIYNPREGRIEMHLVSLRDQDATISGRQFHFREGESIHTENSYKYTVDEFQGLALKAGWNPRNVWTDDANQFSIHALENKG